MPLASARVREMDNMILETIVVTDFATNCYILGCRSTRKGAVIDPGGNATQILDALRGMDLEIVYVINTHGHIDHIGANGQVLEATGAKLVAHALDAPMLANPSLNLGAYLGRNHVGPPADQLVGDGDVLRVGSISLEVIYTPGHTPGGIALYSADDGLVFSGDSLFRGSIGRTDFPGGDQGQLLASIRTRLYALPETTVVCSGHGPETTIGEEKRSNPWA